MEQNILNRIRLDTLMLGRVFSCQWQAFFKTMTFLKGSLEKMEKKKIKNERERVKISRAIRIQKKLRAFFVVIGNTPAERKRLNGA